MARIARVLPEAEAPCDCWNIEITEWFYVDTTGDWLYRIKESVPPGREIQRALVTRCVEELKPQRILVDGVELDAFSWHETTMMLHGYRAMLKNGELQPVNYLFGVLCDAVVRVDLEVANKAMDAEAGSE